MTGFDWPAAGVAIAGMVFIFGVLSRSKVSKEECDKRHKETDSTVMDLTTITARLDERVKTLFTLQETQTKLADRQVEAVEKLEQIVRENGRRE
jgi:hypothetical protein